MSCSKFRIASLARSSVARGCAVPLGKMVSLSMLVRSSTLEISAESSSTSSNPRLEGRPSIGRIEGRATSASTSMTVWSSSAAMLMARLSAVKLLPSPATALVTMMRLPCVIAAVPFPIALRMRGRLTTRNWSAMRDRGAIGVTMPLRSSASKSSSTRLDETLGFAGALSAGAMTSSVMPGSTDGAG